jgi:CubicO group peptidase (beta-lactamase class C family)
MRRYLSLVGIISLLLLLSHSCTFLSPEAETIPDLDAEINRIMAENQIPSIAACIVKDDTIVWQRNYGYADYENRTVTQSETIFELASVSKLAVVTAVMQLSERGLIDLSSDVGSYLPFRVRNPQYPEYKITPLHLLTHTSGLAWPTDEDRIPGFYDNYSLDSAPPMDKWLPQYILTSGAWYRPAVWKNTIPGKRELYSNIGIALLAHIVERVSGSDFNSYCRINIFEPLQMTNTSYDFSDLVLKKVARIYTDNYTAIGYDRQLAFPTADLKSTVEDFSHLVIAYMNGGRYRTTRILSEKSIDEMLTMQNPASGRCLIWDCDLGNWYGHSGGMPGVSTHVEFQRDAKLGVLIFSNKRNKLVYPGTRIHGLIRREANRYLEE